MRLSKLALLLFISGLTITANAQNTVFKCEDSKGVISYLNQPESGYKCSETKLGDLKNIATIKNEGGKLPAFSSTSSNKVNSNKSDVDDFNKKMAEQIKENEANNRRVLVLNKEIEEEKKLLKTVDGMLANISDKNTPEAQRILDIQKNHKRNIEALEVQIAKLAPKKSIDPVMKNTTSNGLPLSIPHSELKTAIVAGNKIGNINDLPTNQLVVDREAVSPSKAITTVNYGKQIESAKTAEEALRMSSLALDEARKQLEDIEKKAKEAREAFEKEKLEKEVVEAKNKLKQRDLENKKLKEDILKIEDELLVIMKRQNLLLEERNFLWSKQEKLEKEKEIIKEKRLIEEEKKKESLKNEKINLLNKKRDLEKNKLKVLEEQRKILKEKGEQLIKNKELIEKI